MKDQKEKNTVTVGVLSIVMVTYAVHRSMDIGRKNHRYDAEVNEILDLPVTTTRIHESQIAPWLIKRNPENIDILLGDKGYDE